MKKTLKYLSMALICSGLLTSCDEDDSFNNDTIDLGGYAYLNDQQLSVFDVNEPLSISVFTKEGISAESMEITKDGSTIATPEISENITFGSSTLGDFMIPEAEEDTSYAVTIKTTYSNGHYSTDHFDILLENAILIDEDNPSEVLIDSLDNLTLAYINNTLSANIDALSLDLKKNEAGSYISNTVDQSEEEEVSLSSTNYSDLNLAVNDTLYYRFSATSGELSNEAESMLVITAPDEEETEE